MLSLFIVSKQAMSDTDPKELNNEGEDAGLENEQSEQELTQEVVLEEEQDDDDVVEKLDEGFSLQPPFSSLQSKLDTLYVFLLFFIPVSLLLHVLETDARSAVRRCLS